MMRLAWIVAASALAFGAVGAVGAPARAQAAQRALATAPQISGAAEGAGHGATRVRSERPRLGQTTGRRSAAARRTARAPTARVDHANRASTREPSEQGYVNAAQVYPWTEGALYRLYAAPGRVSDIALQPGEAVISVAAGDTLRWVIGDTTSGSGAARRSHILVKPSAVGLRTNLVVATDRRVYHVQLESTARSAMPSISWTYAGDELLALGGTAPTAAAETQAAVAGEIALEALNFNYRIKGDEPPWRPVRAFDDGRQVFIEFPAGLAASEAPPLFVLGAAGKAELVNYRLRGRYYVVDRLFERAELRLGERRQKIVRIIRLEAKGERRRLATRS